MDARPYGKFTNMQNTELIVRTGETPAGAGRPQKTEGDYRFSYRVGPAKGLYEFSAGTLEWIEPKDENVHLDVFVHDARDGRFVPGLSMNVTLLDAKGGRAASTHLPFVWDPQEHHYGANVKVEQSGAYVLQIHVFPATFARAGKEEGTRYVADVDAQFENVRIDL